MTNQLTLNSNAYTDLLVQANNLRRGTDYKAALACYFKILEQFGGDAHLFALMADCCLRLDFSSHGKDPNSGESIVWLKKAIALTPDNSHLYAALGELYSLAFVDYQQAALAYRKAIELDSGNFDALVGAAALYGTPDNVVTLDEAIQWLERATQIDPDDPNYLFRLGEFYWEANRLAEAEGMLRRALMCSQPLDVGPTQLIRRMLRLDTE